MNMELIEIAKLIPRLDLQGKVYVYADGRLVKKVKNTILAEARGLLVALLTSTLVARDFAFCEQDKCLYKFCAEGIKGPSGRVVCAHDRTYDLDLVMWLADGDIFTDNVHLIAGGAADVAIRNSSFRITRTFLFDRDTYAKYVLLQASPFYHYNKTACSSPCTTYNEPYNERPVLAYAVIDMTFQAGVNYTIEYEITVG